MKSSKLFDKYVAQSVKWQFFAMAAVFVVLILVGGVIGMSVIPSDSGDVARFGYNWLWGLMHCVDGGYVGDTLGAVSTNSSDGAISRHAAGWIICASVFYWFVGLVLVAFFTGAVTNFLEARRGKILAGDVDYSFDSDYVLVVGYDFQVKNLIKALLARWDGRTSIVLVTDTPVEGIYDEVLPELKKGEAHRLYVMRKDITVMESYRNLRISGANEIYVIGDGGAVGRDGKALQAQLMIADTAKAERGGKTPEGNPIKFYLHVEDTVLYAQVRAIELPTDKVGGFDTEVYNYYESWAWKCWSMKNAHEVMTDAPYLPLRHRPGSSRVELFVIGAGRMGRAVATYALPLLNYGSDGKNCRVTVFDANPLKKGFLPDKEVLDGLPECEVRYSTADGCSDEANAAMVAAAERDDTSVTVVIALSDPGAAIRAYSELSNRLRRREVSVLVWQACHSKDCPDKRYLRMGGPDSTADKTALRYFGMTDVLPWQESTRFEDGSAINYYYNLWFPWGQTPPKSPAIGDADFAETARRVWDEKKCQADWQKTKRWKKWSSVSSADTFREKGTLIDGPVDGRLATLILKAEHNRWWTERLLAGWTYSPELCNKDEAQDKANLLHGNMVPFEDLTPVTQDKDKINVAAMFARGFGVQG